MASAFSSEDTSNQSEEIHGRHVFIGRASEVSSQSVWLLHQHRQEWLADVRLVGNDGYLLANRKVLRAASGYFRKILESPSVEGVFSGQVDLSQYSVNVLELMLEYIFTGQTSVAEEYSEQINKLFSIFSREEIKKLLQVPVENYIYESCPQYTSANKIKDCQIKKKYINIPSDVLVSLLEYAYLGQTWVPERYIQQVARLGCLFDMDELLKQLFLTGAVLYTDHGRTYFSDRFTDSTAPNNLPSADKPMKLKKSKDKNPTTKAKTEKTCAPPSQLDNPSLEDIRVRKTSAKSQKTPDTQNNLELDTKPKKLKAKKADNATHKVKVTETSVWQTTSTSRYTCLSLLPREITTNRPSCEDIYSEKAAQRMTLKSIDQSILYTTKTSSDNFHPDDKANKAIASSICKPDENPWVIKVKKTKDQTRNLTPAKLSKTPKKANLKKNPIPGKDTRVSAQHKSSKIVDLPVNPIHGTKGRKVHTNRSQPAGGSLNQSKLKNFSRGANPTNTKTEPKGLRHAESRMHNKPLDTDQAISKKTARRKIQLSSGITPNLQPTESHIFPRDIKGIKASAKQKHRSVDTSVKPKKTKGVKAIKTSALPNTLNFADIFKKTTKDIRHREGNLNNTSAKKTTLTFSSLKTNKAKVYNYSLRHTHMQAQFVIGGNEKSYVNTEQCFKMDTSIEVWEDCTNVTMNRHWKYRRNHACVCCMGQLRGLGGWKAVALYDDDQQKWGRMQKLDKKRAKSFTYERVPTGGMKGADERALAAIEKKNKEIVEQRRRNAVRFRKIPGCNFIYERSRVLTRGRKRADMGAKTAKNKKVKEIVVRRTHADEVDELEQYALGNTVRFRGVAEPDVPNQERTKTIVLDLLTSILGLSVQQADIFRSYRVGNAANTKPRDIFVEFISHDIKTDVLKSCKKLKAFQVFVNEDLTRLRGTLAYWARDLRRQRKIKGTWTMDGAICFRLNDGTVTKIETEAQYRAMCQDHGLPVPSTVPY